MGNDHFLNADIPTNISLARIKYQNRVNVELTPEKWLQNRTHMKKYNTWCKENDKRSFRILKMRYPESTICLWKLTNQLSCLLF